RRAVTEALDRMGLWYAPSSATLYVWTRVPGGMMSARFASDLLEGAGVSLAPGTAFGPHGEGYVRISLVQPVARLEEAMARWKQWMG
ncbi:MAG TPA: aminotransferase class I/II-fold pyridoxal phosphate-dependent enzyme, partial [Anaerolineae bacterium]|nr:aminotransferase class I/II-fold pyridoxal phosphate-dependent enzyme [Anaerolineae bacterium]